MSEDDLDVMTVVETSEQIKFLLRGKAPMVQGAVLADLLATWLLDHIVEDDKVETDRWRDRLLHLHIEHVRELVKASER
jgi:hemerythrin